MQHLVGHSVVSLFAGIGGFDLGFQRAGFRVVAHVEKDANCRKLLAAKWPDAVALDDVCTAGAHNLPPCDVITFGFPCQDLSVAGKRAGLAGGRSGLFYEATRIINEIKPAYCLFENVPGLLSSDGGRDFARVLMEMDRIGYHGAWRVLDAQWLGVAQRRRRVFGLFSRLDSGAERCAEILSLRESLRGHPAPRREAGQGATYSVAPCLAASGRGTERTGESRGQDPVIALPAVCGSLTDGAHNGGGLNGQDAYTGRVIPVVGSLSCNTGPAGHDAGKFACNQAVDAGHLIPVAFGGDVARTLAARHDSSPCADRGMDVVAVPVAVTQNKPLTQSRETDTLLLQPITERISHANATEADAGTILRLLRKTYGEKAYVEWRDSLLAAFQPTEVLRQAVYGSGMDGEAFTGNESEQRQDQGEEKERQRAVRIVRAGRSAGCPPQGQEHEQQHAREPSADLPFVPQHDSPETRAVQGVWKTAEGTWILREALSALQEVRRPAHVQAQPAQSAMQVRRLTPRCCERLQGFQWRCDPTDPGAWQDELGRWWSPDYTAGFSDSNRYKMLGNAVCVNVSAWIAGMMANNKLTHGGPTQ